MSDLLTDFKRDCEAVGVKPLEVFRAAKVNPSCWWRWDKGTISPTIKTFQIVRTKLDELLDAAKQDTAA